MQKSVLGKLAATAVAGMLVVGGIAHAEGAAATAHAKKCTNACKGKSECKGKTNACKGQNACKGKGWVNAGADGKCPEGTSEVK